MRVPRGTSDRLAFRMVKREHGTSPAFFIMKGNTPYPYEEFAQAATNHINESYKRREVSYPRFSSRAISDQILIQVALQGGQGRIR